MKYFELALATVLVATHVGGLARAEPPGPDPTSASARAAALAEEEEEMARATEEARRRRRLLEQRRSLLAAEKRNRAMERDLERVESEAEPPVAERRLLHGFRLGYLYFVNYDRALPGKVAPRDQLDMESPHQFLIGYELTGRLVGNEWLDVLTVTNVMVGGLEQSRFYPTANLLFGFELARAFQLAVGVNFSPVRDKPAHVVLAGGWAPPVGRLNLPIHFFFVPDKDFNHRMGITLGVNWGL
jgi:hypothetical protein